MKYRTVVAKDVVRAAAVGQNITKHITVDQHERFQLALGKRILERELLV